jgi:hypothetical protein
MSGYCKIMDNLTTSTNSPRFYENAMKFVRADIKIRLENGERRGPNYKLTISI